MQYQIGEYVTPIDRDWVRREHLTPGKTYEVLGVMRGHVQRREILLAVDDDTGVRREIHESWFQYAGSVSV